MVSARPSLFRELVGTPAGRLEHTVFWPLLRAQALPSYDQPPYDRVHGAFAPEIPCFLHQTDIKTLINGQIRPCRARRLPTNTTLITASDYAKPS
jgi:hypothetical protein